MIDPHFKWARYRDRKQRRSPCDPRRNPMTIEQIISSEVNFAIAADLRSLRAAERIVEALDKAGYKITQKAPTP